MLQSGLADEPDQTPVNAGRLQLPHAFGPYVLLEELGRGGMGVVFAARQPSLQRVVAVKLILSGSYASESALQRFRTEAAAAAGLQHPNIVEIHDYGEWGGQPYYVMDLIRGRNLAQVCDGRPLEPDRAASVLCALADAVHCAHLHGILHRDLKPSNVLVDESGHVRITDFGLARRVDGDSCVTQVDHVVGSPSYTSPEQAAGRTDRVSTRSDVYGLGAILYHMLTGRAPFTAKTPTDTLRLVLERDPLPLRALNPAVPRDLETICLKCLSREPQHRYPSADELGGDVKRFLENRPILARPPSAVYRVSKLVRRRRFGVAAFASLTALVAAILWMQHRASQGRWAREDALPEIGRLVESGDWDSALALADRASASLPNDPQLREILSRISSEVEVETTPPGAEVFVKAYDKPESPWRFLGVTPLHKVRLSSSCYLWRFSTGGYADRERALMAYSWAPVVVTLYKHEETPPEMVHVDRQPYSPDNSITGLEPLAMSEYLIDRHEVTNRQFQAFVDQGGYQDQRYWKEPFVRDGIRLSWEEAMAIMVDTTGRPGPATWRDGGYPPGREDYPVTGVSWYEAAAYAAYAGKRLPTVYHWRWAASVPGAVSIVPQSNFESSGPAAVGTYLGISQWGAYDMAGSAREWCSNESSPGTRYLLGGAWSEPHYVYYLQGDTEPPFDRSALNGFRCIRLLGGEMPDPAAEEPIPLLVRDYSMEIPVSDEIARSYANLFSYDKTPLDVQIGEVDDTNPEWRRETVSFNAAYNEERVPAVLFLPRNVEPPYQAVLIFPSANALHIASWKKRLAGWQDVQAIIRMGRAVVYPIYKYTYERRRDPPLRLPMDSIVYRDGDIQMVKDLRRTLDYLETRKDMRTDAVGYYGGSWGAIMGALIPAVENRIKVSILVGGGLPSYPRQPENDPINYVRHVTIPTLMLNGRHDFTFPLETSQKPMFRLLGTPEKDKRHVVFNSGHAGPAPPGLLTEETLAWLDKYLGPVNKQPDVVSARHPR